VARDILAAARAAIENPANSDAEAVHDFRRAMRRWRALLRLLEPFVGTEAKRLRDEARDLAQALTGARNAQSALDALGDLEKHGLVLSPPAVRGLRHRIEEIRRSAETTLNGDLRRRLGSTLDHAASIIEPISSRSSSLCGRVSSGCGAVKRSDCAIASASIRT
jgi:CHAD domain-containing protein